MRLRACILAIAVVTPLRAFAQTPAAPADAPPPPPPPVVTPTPPPPPEPMPPPVAVAAPMAPEAPAAAPAAAPKLTWGGWLDTYYMFNFIRPDNSNTLVPPVGRAFDTNSNSATMSMAAATLTASMDPVSFQLDMGYGSMGTIINYAGLGGALTPPLPTAGVIPPVGPSFVLLQAYGSITVLGKLTLDFGKFYTTAGAEVIPTNKNWLYSRSLLFNIIPLLHTGARANFKVNDMLSLQASVLNGWNDDPDVNAWKDVGLSAAITPNSMLTIAITEYLGKPLPQGIMASTPGDLRSLTDVVVGVTINDKIGLNFNGDFISGYNGNSSDYQVGGAAMARFVINDNLNVAARGEFVRTHNDVGSLNQDLMEGTVMVGLPVGKNFELRPEFRYDHAGQNTLILNGKNNQVTGTLAALAYF